MDRPYIAVIRSIFLQLHGKSVLYLTELQQMLVLPMRITDAKMVLHDERSAFPVDGTGDGFRWIGYRHTGINEVHAAAERRLEYALNFIRRNIFIAVIADANANRADFLTVWQESVFHILHHFIALSTSSGVSGLPIMGAVLSSERREDISSSVRLKSNTRMFSAMRSAWMDLGMTVTPS